MPAKMTEAEWEALKKKTGKREPQKVTTYYEENKQHEEGLKHHKERREQNVAARNKQSGFIEGLKRKVTRKPDDQKVKTYYKPTPRKPAAKPAAKPKPSKVQRAVNTVNRGRSAVTSTVNEFGGLPMPPAWMMGTGSPPSQPRAAPAPRRRKRQPAYEESYEPSWQDMGGVPEHVRRFMF
jgi:hypothetical protein